MKVNTIKFEIKHQDIPSSISISAIIIQQYCIDFGILDLVSIHSCWQNSDTVSNTVVWRTAAFKLTAMLSASASAYVGCYQLY